MIAPISRESHALGQSLATRIRRPSWTLCSLVELAHFAFFAFFALPLFALTFAPAEAKAAQPLPSHPDNPYTTSGRYASLLVVDAVTGDVLLENQPDLTRAPASVVKMMTLLLLLEAVDRGELTLSSEIEVPWRSSKIGGSGVGLVSHEKLTVEETAQALLISSGNDAAIAIAEHLAGSEVVFATRMNRRARELGMSDTYYYNAHGLDGWGPSGSITTAHDQAKLARKLLEFPKTLEWSSNRSVTIRGGQAIHTTNKLLGRVEGVDGLKTGYTGKAGFCLVATAERDDLRIISVLLGGTNGEARFEESAWAISEAFLRFRREVPVRAGDRLGKIAFANAVPPEVEVIADTDVELCLPRTEAGEIETVSRQIRGLSLPIQSGAALTKVEVRLGDRVLARTNGIAASTVRSKTWMERLRSLFQR